MKYLLISLILLPLTGTAQTYTLEECCRLALEQNAKIKTATNDRSVAVMEKKEAFTNFLPSVSLMGGAMKADDAMLQMAMAVSLASRMTSYSISLKPLMLFSTST